MPKTASIAKELPITIVGLGGVGLGLSKALKSAGFLAVTLIGKGRAGEQRLVKALKVNYLSQVEELQQEQGVIILALREDQLSASVHDLTQLSLSWKKITVLHTSGSLGAEVLQPLARLGAGIAAWHPFQTFPKRAKGVTLAGVTFGIDGNRRGMLAANRLTRALRGVPLRVAGKDRVLYHLSAVLACGFVAADLQMAVEVLKKIGIPEKRALQAVLPIARETLEQIAALGIQSAMTGPAVRGDLTTVLRHLRALTLLNPEMAKVYSTVSGYVLKSQKAQKPKSQN
jgi:predicted short-subunit dehydrogenase-like oxidoreductase (DUF2520 family)